METKLSKLVAAANDGDWQRALSIAAKFARLGDHKTPIVRGHEAYVNPGFYAQLGRDPEQLKSAGIEALKQRYHL